MAFARSGGMVSSSTCFVVRQVPDFFAASTAARPVSGVSIHLVDADYDTGAIVRQCRVPVIRGDSLDDLKARVRAREKEFVVETLGQIAKGEIRLVAGAG